VASETVAADTALGGLAARYAGALISEGDSLIAAGEASALDSFAANVATLTELMNTHAGFRALVASPTIAAGEQVKAVLAVAENLGLHPKVRNFLGVVATNRRLSQLPKMLAAFRAMLAAKRGQISAEVTSAVALTDTQMLAVRARLTEAGYPNVELIARVDEKILGGLIVKIGSRLYDASVRSKLQRLQYAMKEAA
jgi:F-type H+-transporting ATPase subunit delta